MAWQFNSKQAVFVQISDRLRRDIISGKYPPDSQFPAVRQLAMEAAVNPNTMQKALSVLEEEGLLCAKGTIGRFVTSDTSALETARDAVRRDTLKRLLDEIRDLGITTDELIDTIKKEEDNHEHTRS